MSSIQDELYALIEHCMAVLAQMKPQGGTFNSPSSATKQGYLRTAKQLLRRAHAGNGSLSTAALETTKSNTFYTRLAALRYHANVELSALMTRVQAATEEADYQQLKPLLAEHLLLMQAVVDIQSQGLAGRGTKRSSKRQALKGLPPNWRETICNAAAQGKYALPMLVSALTGARPSELARGTKVWMEQDQHLGTKLICFEIIGSKVKGQQGQPSRRIAFHADDQHPLVVAMGTHLHIQSVSFLQVQIASAVNFTVEIRRLAARLWPSHMRAVTAYCFRHQWAADAKRLGDGDSVSRGLGHASAKTRRFYGTSNQSTGAYGLRPLRIDADRAIRSVASSYYFVSRMPGDDSDCEPS